MVWGLWVRMTRTFQQGPLLFFQGLIQTALRWKHHQSLICNQFLLLIWDETLWHRNWLIFTTSLYRLVLDTLRPETNHDFRPFHIQQVIPRASDLWQRASFEGCKTNLYVNWYVYNYVCYIFMRVYTSCKYILYYILQYTDVHIHIYTVNLHPWTSQS